MITSTAQESRTKPDIRELQARLTALPGNQDNAYEANEWVFRDSRQKIQRLCFDHAATVLAAYPEWVKAKGIDPVPLAKQLALSLAERGGITSYVKMFRGLLVWMAAMANNDVTTLSRESLPRVLKFRLTHSVSASGVYHMRELIGFSGLNAPSLFRFQEICDELELPWFSRNVTEQSVKNALKKLISTLSDGELTYKDWQRGKSCNLLTLDHGRYYVEHCLNIFEEHAPLALALHKTQLAIDELSESTNIRHSTLKICLSRILEGRKPEEIDPKAPNYVRRIQGVVMDYFRSAYRQTRFEHELLQEGTLAEIANAFGLAQTHENVDRLRVIFWDWLQRGLKQESQRLLDECQTPVTWTLFEQTLESVRQRCDNEFISIPTPSFFSELGLNQGKTTGPVNQFISWVAKAGLTGMVALTGWRKSEFGFPWSVVQQTQNKDKLDEYAFPYRYQVDWYVYKTNGSIRTLREITFSSITIIDRARRLNDSSSDRPCLYRSNAAKQERSESEGAVEAAVIYLWPHFVQHYPGFKLLDNLNAWQTLKETEASEGLLTMKQHSEREKLLAQRPAQEWDTLTIDENLRNTWHRTRAELLRLSFIWSKNSKEQDWVVQYRQSILRQDWAELLDLHLSYETREWLFALSLEEVKTSNNIGKTLANEVVGDAIYPSPHAFRHMWAESVYRRFDGDAGWLIRSQFKHISQRMWLAYVRDKDNRINHERAKLQVVHSLVANFIRHKGQGYAGQMTVLLRRLSQRTKVLTPDEQKELTAKLATQEIENLKSNPWGYCLLLRRSRHKAKCAQGGEPQRHNASPKLCLGCIHNLMQTNNVEWMIFHVLAHVEALNNPVVPDIFKKSSYELVRNTVRHIRKLDPGHEALPELATSLANYQRAA